jgi:N-acetylmuramoyl-L-alanine amidase
MDAERVDERLDLEGLLSSPAEEGDYDCTTPEEFAGDEDGLERPETPIAGTCSRRHKAAHDSGKRSLAQIGLIVLHCTQSNSARSSAEWFANPASQGSAHLLVDDFECYRALDDDVIPWAAKGANTRGFHIEITGWASWSRAEWMKHEQTLRRAAFKAAWHATKYGVPLKLLTAAQLRAGQKGFATHAMCTQAFGGDHTDPGQGCPVDQLMRWTQDYADEINRAQGDRT